MIIIGELINASRKAIKAAIEAQSLLMVPLEFEGEDEL